MDYTEGMALVGMAIAIFGGALLLRIPDQNVKANRVLTLTLMLFSGSFFFRFLAGSGIYLDYPHLLGIFMFTKFLWGPLLYLYLQLLTRPDFKIHAKHAVHLLPALLSFAAYIPIILLPVAAKAEYISIYLQADMPSGLMSPVIEHVNPETVLIQKANRYQLIALVCVLTGYLVVCLQQLSAHRRALLNEFSVMDRLTLSWLRNLITLVMITNVLALPLLMFSAVGESYILLRVQVFDALLVFNAIYIAYNGICQPLIYRGEKLTAVAPESIPGEPVKKYQSSGLSEEGQHACWQEVKALMDKEKPYLTHGLTLAELSEQLDLPLAYVSQTINAESGMSFFDFINSYRIQEAVSLLDEHHEGKALALTNLYIEVGFNSKSSFYGQFKKYNEGLTPTQYLAAKQ